MWQPIETAPRNFTPILVFVPAPRYGGIQEEPDEITIAFWKRNGFRRQSDDHMHVDPTHWMPLPGPPAGHGESSPKQEGVDGR